MGADCLRIFAGAGRSNSHAFKAENSTFRLFLIDATLVQTQREGECTEASRSKGTGASQPATFSLSTVDGRVALAIGGMQGPKAGHKREVIDVTRDLHGLRAQGRRASGRGAISDGLGSAVHAVGDALHVHRALPEHPKYSSYDAYWAERGAIAGGPFGFVVPPLDALPTSEKKARRGQNSHRAAARQF